MPSWLKKKKPSHLNGPDTLAVQGTPLLTLVEKILLDHQENGHRVILMSSASERDCVERIGDALGDLLGQRCQLKTCVLKRRHSAEALPMCRRLSEATSQGYDLVILVVPGLLTPDFPATVLNHCDVCVLTVVAGGTRRIHVKDALRTLQHHDIPVLGTILCNTRQIIPSWFYHRCFGSPA